MKYIRLKNGRIVNQFETVRIDSIVKKADTIEELCDIFVRWNIHYIPQNTDTFIRTKKVDAIYKNFNKAKYGFKVNGYELYGAIWTDKGLIYVAKMNEKGELKLL